MTYLAMDIGASSGKLIRSCLADGKIKTEVVCRFENSLIERNGHLCWDIDRLYDEMVAGLRLAGKADWISIDTWAVDYVLLDGNGKRISDAVSYRDSRTDNVSCPVSRHEMYQHTGIQYQKFNTVYQLLAQKEPEFSRQLGVVVLGSRSEQCASLFPFPIYNMNYVSNEKELVDIYNAVDLYVTPSLQDNLPNTIVEAMACGIPCVGFNVGGIPQMIDHLHNGYVARYKSAEDLANGIRWALTEGDYETLSAEANRKALNTYSETTVAQQYIKIYNQITGSNA